MMTVVLVKETEAELIHKSRAMGATAASYMPNVFGFHLQSVTSRTPAARKKNALE
jgi:hypothetical protein